MVLRRRIRSDMMTSKVHHPESLGMGDGADSPLGVRRFRLFEDSVQVDRAAAPASRQGVG